MALGMSEAPTRTGQEVPVRFIGLSDLLTNKRAVGRPKDLADVAALEHDPAPAA